MEKEKLDELMAAVAEGDNEAFEKLYLATAKGVYVFAYSYVNNKSDAEDLMQTAFLQIKKKAYTYQKGTNARAWMLQIVKNLALDELRRRKRERERLADADKAESASYEFSENTALEYMMRSLNGEEREIVLLHVFWGYKHREIAKKLNLPLGTVTWRYNKAIKKLEKFREDV